MALFGSGILSAIQNVQSLAEQAQAEQDRIAATNAQEQAMAGYEPPMAPAPSQPVDPADLIRRLSQTTQQIGAMVPQAQAQWWDQQAAQDALAATNAQELAMFGESPPLYEGPFGARSPQNLRELLRAQEAAGLVPRSSLAGASLRTLGGIYGILRGPAEAAGAGIRSVLPGAPGRILGTAAEFGLDPATIGGLAIRGPGLISNLLGRGALGLPAYAALTAGAGLGAGVGEELGGTLGAFGGSLLGGAGALAAPGLGRAGLRYAARAVSPELAPLETAAVRATGLTALEPPPVTVAGRRRITPAPGSAQRLTEGVDVAPSVQPGAGSVTEAETNALADAWKQARRVGLQVGVIQRGNRWELQGAVSGNFTTEEALNRLREAVSGATQPEGLLPPPVRATGGGSLPPTAPRQIAPRLGTREETRDSLSGLTGSQLREAAAAAEVEPVLTPKTNQLSRTATISRILDKVVPETQARRDLYDAGVFTGGPAPSGLSDVEQRSLSATSIGELKAQLRSDLGVKTKAPQTVMRISGKEAALAPDSLQSVTLEAALGRPLTQAEGKFLRQIEAVKGAAGVPPHEPPSGRLASGAGAPGGGFSGQMFNLTRSIWDELRSAAFAPTSLLSSYSPPLLRQGKIRLLVSPVNAAKEFASSIRAMFSEETGQAILRKITDSPWISAATTDGKKSPFAGYTWRELGGAVTKWGQDVPLVEREAFYEGLTRSRIARFVGQFVKPSERQTSIEMNLHRTQWYETLAQALWDAGERRPSEYRGLVHVIGDATQYGPWGPTKIPVTFSTRAISGRARLLVDPFIQPGSLFKPSARQEAVKALGALAVFNVGLMGLLDATGAVDVTWTNGLPTARVGPYHLDPWAGTNSIIKLIVRAARHIESGRTNKLDDDLLDFGRKQLGPTAGKIADIWTQKDWKGAPYSLKQDLHSRNFFKDLLIPMFIPSIIEGVQEGMKRGGLEGGLIGGAVSAPALLSEGVSAYTSPREVARDLFAGADYYQLSPRDQVAVHKEMLRLGAQVTTRDRVRPYQTADDYAYTEIRNANPGNEELQRYETLQEYRDAYMDWAMRPQSQGGGGFPSLAAASTARQKEEARLTMQVNGVTWALPMIALDMRKEAIANDPDIIDALLELHNQGKLQYPPSKELIQFAADVRAGKIKPR